MSANNCYVTHSVTCVTLSRVTLAARFIFRVHRSDTPFNGIKRSTQKMDPVLVMNLDLVSITQSCSKFQCNEYLINNK